MDAVLKVLDRTMVFSGDDNDQYFRTWRELGRYGSARDIVPFQLALARNSRCIDVGANIGYTAVLMSILCPEGHVSCFEPSPRNYAHLERTISKNELTNVELNMAALGDRTGTLRLEEHGPNSHVALEGSGLGIDVPMVS